MSKTIEFLSTLSKEELAFFYKYKLPTYTKATQDVIVNYIENKGMTARVVEEIVSNHKSIAISNEHLNVCPRCSSTKIMEDRIESDRTGPNAGVVDLLPYALNDVQANPEYDFNLICTVCGYWVKHEVKDEKTTFWSRFWDLIFG